MKEPQDKPGDNQVPRDFSLGSQSGLKEKGALAPGFSARIAAHFPPGQFFRYLAVGVFNTLFGYSTYVLFFKLFSATISANHPSLIAPLASIVSTPLNITVAYFGYKLFVFKTHGNYLAEWLKCFGVYGVGMLPGLIALSALTRLLQALFEHHAHIAHPSSIAAYVAGALVQGFVVIASFFGHKKVTFAPKSVTR